MMLTASGCSEGLCDIFLALLNGVCHFNALCDVPCDRGYRDDPAILHEWDAAHFTEFLLTVFGDELVDGRKKCVAGEYVKGIIEGLIHGVRMQDFDILKGLANEVFRFISEDLLNVRRDAQHPELIVV